MNLAIAEGITMDTLLKKALDMRQYSHAPHSHFKVGSAILTADGTIYGGCNIESDVYGLTMCAERSAIFNAFSQGHRSFIAIAVATSTQGTPCGACRQIIAELCGNVTLYTTDLKGNIATYKAYDLIPHHFTLKHFTTIPYASKNHDFSI